MIEKTFVNNQLGIKFNSYIGHKCRVWFKAKEVAQKLGYRDTDKAIRKHTDNEDRKYFPAKMAGYSKIGRPPIFINESGFYSLVLSSKLETAKKFKRWITSEVLPSIRKDGYYKMIDLRIKQRVIIDGVKYYKHQVFSNYASNKNGDIINVKTKKNIKMINCNGYLCFNIYDKKLEKPKNYYQHRFVYEVFRGLIPRCFEVDHINNFKFDNRIKNLQLLTHKQNVIKSNSKPIISKNIETGEEKKFISIQVASNELKISYSIISKICRKKGKTATSKTNGHKYTFKFLY